LATFYGGTLAVSAADGKQLWRHTRIVANAGNVHTAIVRDGTVFASGGWGAGCALLKPTPDGRGGFRVEELHFQRHRFDSWLGSSALVGEHIYTCQGLCIELKTGALAWSRRDLLGRNTMTAADGHLYFRRADGTVILVEASPEKYVEKGRFRPAHGGKEPAWTFPVIADGRLYLRDQDALHCYDLRRP